MNAFLEKKTLTLRILGFKEYNTKHLSIIVHTLGIYLFYSLANIYQEKISTMKYEGVKFNSIYLPIILQSIGATLASYVLCRIRNERLVIKNNNILYNYLLLSFLSMISTVFWYYSLSFLSYPTVIISKSCKLLSIAIMNFLVFKKRLSSRKYATIILTTVSVLGFAILGKSKKSQNGFSFLGICILLFNLSIDGFLNVTQDNLFKKYHVSSSHMMFYNNIIRLFIASGLFYLTNDYVHTLQFVTSNNEVLLDLLCASLLGVLGQLVIYSMLERHGSYALTTINITRKIFSIVLSLIFFGHEVSNLQWLCIFGVILSISLECLDKKLKKE